MQRREFVEAMAAALAAALGAAKWAELSAASAYAAEVPGSAPFEYLTAEQARLLDAITSLIVPTDDTPGAREAHVVRFIDHAFATFFTDFRKDLTDALQTFTEFAAGFHPDRVPFVDLPASQQIAALRELERLKPEVFGPLRDLTMTGMFSSPEHGGNFRKVGWRLIGYVDQFSWAPPFGYYDRGRA